MNLEEEILKLINAARESEQIRLADEKDKHGKEWKIKEQHFVPIHEALKIARNEFEKSGNISFTMREHATTYADIDLKNNKDLFRIGLSCTLSEDNTDYRVTYLMNVINVYEGREYYKRHFEKNEGTELLSKTFKIIASFEARGYLTGFDCQ